MDCCYVSCDYDSYATVCNIDIVRARKPYKCCECGEAIDVGEQYERATGKWEGDWNTFRTCLGCLDCRGAFACGWNFTTFWEEFFDACDGDVSLAALDKLSLVGRAKFSDQLAEHLAAMADVGD